MSNEGFKLQVSVKDTDGDMVNVRADSAEELDHYLNNFPVAAYAQFKANVRGGSSLGGIVQPTPAPAPAAQQPAGWSNSPGPAPSWAAGQQAAPAAPVAPAARLHPEGESCSCGQTLQYKEVTRKSDNKTFKFWACPNQQKRGDGHRSEFAD